MFPRLFCSPLALLVCVPLALPAGSAQAQTPAPEAEAVPEAAPTAAPTPALSEEELKAALEALEACKAEADPAAKQALCDDVISAAKLAGTPMAEAHIARGEAFHLQGTFPLAIADYETAIKLHPGHPRAHLRRGQVLDSMGRTERALEDIDYALFLNPGYPDALKSRAIIYCELERYDESVTDRLQLIEEGHWDAKDAQQWFTDLGYYEGPVDGNFADASVAALRTWTEQGCPRP